VGRILMSVMMSVIFATSVPRNATATCVPSHLAGSIILALYYDNWLIFVHYAMNNNLLPVSLSASEYFNQDIPSSFDEQCVHPCPETQKSKSSAS
jgi:hypothetical protein